MKRNTGILLACSLFMSSCSILEDQTDANGSASLQNNLTVYFTNSTASRFPITGIELRPMGSYTHPNATGTWGNSILTGDTLYPGEKKTFVLPIPTGELSHCRLTVIDSLQQEIKLDERIGFDTTLQTYATITHWGSDERTVEVTIDYNSSSKLIWVSGWSEWAGKQ